MLQPGLHGGHWCKEENNGEIVPGSHSFDAEAARCLAKLQASPRPVAAMRVGKFSLAADGSGFVLTHADEPGIRRLLMAAG